MTRWSWFLGLLFLLSFGTHAAEYRDVPRAEREHLAVVAGLGKLNGDGKLTVPRYGTKVHIVDIIFTDLPMQADG